MDEKTKTDKESPKIKLALEEKYQEEDKAQPEPLSPDNLGSNSIEELPEPAGYRILVLPFTPKNKSKGGILFSQETLDKARISTTCGYVLRLGDLAYKDTENLLSLGVNKEIGLSLLVMRVQDYR